MNKIITAALVLSVAVGCGVSDGKALSDIDAGLWTKICDKATKDSVAETITCDEVEIEIPATSSADCQTSGNALSAADGCTATFGDWKTCQEFEPADECDFEDVSPSCTKLFDCLVPAE